jgi:serine/threonine protein kinase
MARLDGGIHERMAMQSLLDATTFADPRALPRPPEVAAAPPSRALEAIGDYLLDELIGFGGMGEVYSAHHRASGVEVAIKLLRQDLLRSSGARARFRREAELMRSMRGPHAVRVHEVFVPEDGWHIAYIVMERLHGVDLEHVLDLRGHLPVEEATHWVLEACEAIADAHALGVVHRDLKPSNLFIAGADEGSVLKVLDFGISRALDDGKRLTRTDSAMGTPAYMSPEQARSSKDADPRADVWSLGVILYELLTGVVPFQGDSPTAIAIAVYTSEPSPPSERNPEISPALERVILRALRKEPSSRFRSATELATALRAAMSGEAETLSPTMAEPLPSSEPNPPSSTPSTEPSGETSPAPRTSRTSTLPAEPRRSTRAGTTALLVAVIGAASLCVAALSEADPAPQGSARDAVASAVPSSAPSNNVADAATISTIVPAELASNVVLSPASTAFTPPAESQCPATAPVASTDRAASAPRWSPASASAPVETPVPIRPRSWNHPKFDERR